MEPQPSGLRHSHSYNSLSAADALQALVQQDCTPRIQQFPGFVDGSQWTPSSMDVPQSSGYMHGYGDPMRSALSNGAMGHHQMGYCGPPMPQLGAAPMNMLYAGATAVGPQHGFAGEQTDVGVRRVLPPRALAPAACRPAGWLLGRGSGASSGPPSSTGSSSGRASSWGSTTPSPSRSCG